MRMSNKKTNLFVEAREARQGNLAGEFFRFFRHNKKFWLIPLILGLLVLGLLILLGGSAAAPFIYTLF